MLSITANRKSARVYHGVNAETRYYTR